jgi:hypothetical protein
MVKPKHRPNTLYDLVHYYHTQFYLTRSKTNKVKPYSSNHLLLHMFFTITTTQNTKNKNNKPLME